MQRSQSVVQKLLQQFKLNQKLYNPKPMTMAEGAESAQQLTDKDLDPYFDIETETQHEISLLLNIAQPNGKPLPVGEFTERQIAKCYQQVTGVGPCAITLMGPRDALLEFDKRIDVIGSSMLVHGSTEWGGEVVSINCLLAKKPQLIRLFNEREESMRKQQEMEKQKETFQREKEQYEKHLGRVVEQMTKKLGQLEKKMDEEVPRISSGMVTPPMLSPRTEVQQLVMTPGLPLFSGTEPTPRDEGTYDQWKFQVKGMRSSCPEHSVRSALITSVRGEASELVGFVGFNAPLEQILAAMEKRFGKRATTDRLQQEFYQLQQDKGEKIQHFAGRLEKAFKKLQEVFPERYQEAQLKERLFHGVNQQTRDSMRYLYDREDTSYETLLAAIKEAETEWLESKNTIRVKSAVVTEQTEIEELREKLEKLTATVKSSNLKKEKKGSPKTSPRKEEGRKSKGPATTAAGPFRPDQKPMQCYKCEGWGHGWRECATKGNVNWGRIHGESAPKEDKAPDVPRQ